MLKKRLQDNTRQDEASFLTAADPQKVKTFWSAEYHAHKLSCRQCRCRCRHADEVFGTLGSRMGFDSRSPLPINSKPEMRQSCLRTLDQRKYPLTKAAFLGIIFQVFYKGILKPLLFIIRELDHTRELSYIRRKSKTLKKMGILSLIMKSKGHLRSKM